MLIYYSNIIILRCYTLQIWYIIYCANIPILTVHIISRLCSHCDMISVFYCTHNGYYQTLYYAYKILLYGSVPSVSDIWLRSVRFFITLEWFHLFSFMIYSPTSVSYNTVFDCVFSDIYTQGIMLYGPTLLSVLSYIVYCLCHIRV